MKSAIHKLIASGSDALADHACSVETSRYVDRFGSPGKELAGLLSRKNGFYAYESALLVRPLSYNFTPLGVVEWNNDSVWTPHYTENLSDVCFFAEDVFGSQFCLRDGSVSIFDPETGLFEPISDSVEGWADEILDDYNYRTGYPVAHSWQVEHGPLKPGERLLPKTPFVCGGTYDIENLYALNDIAGMRFRASIANQIRNLPDGSEIILAEGPAAWQRMGVEPNAAEITGDAADGADRDKAARNDPTLHMDE